MSRPEVRWAPSALDDAEWDARLRAAPHPSPFQSSAWAAAKQAGGWGRRRYVAHEGGAPVALLQVLTRTVAGRLTVGWASGGPALGLEPSARPTEVVQALHDALEAQRELRFVRFDLPDPAGGEASFAATEVFTRVRTPLNPRFSTVVDVRPGAGVDLSAHHRRELKAARRAGVEASIVPAADLPPVLADLQRGMSEAKGLRSFHHASAGDLGAVATAFGHDAVAAVGTSDGRPVAACLVLVCGPVAVLSSSATDADGRRVRAGYAMFTTLLEHLAERGVERFDFGGMAPLASAAAGVNDFKLGFGGPMVERVGEVEWARDRTTRAALDLLVRVRRERL